MTNFQKLDAYLSQEFSDDYWYDDAKFYACELVKQLTTDDWNAQVLRSWVYAARVAPLGGSLVLRKFLQHNPIG